MAVADRQILSELVDCADVAVRSASQLQLFRLGRPVHDEEALTRAAEFLQAAVGGGEFISSGNTASLRATLRPLNWAADVRYSSGRRPSGQEAAEVDYEDLTAFLRKIRSTVEQVAEGQEPSSEDFNECITFLDSLGEILGTRADQYMRRASGPSSVLGSF